MEAKAEPKEFDRQNTDSTMIHDFVAIESSKLNWIAEQRNAMATKGTTDLEAGYAVLRA
jgi:hypothetical protein